MQTIKTLSSISLHLSDIQIDGFKLLVKVNCLIALT